MPDLKSDLLTIATHYAVGKFVEERLKERLEESPLRVLLQKSLLHDAFGPTYIYQVWSLDMVKELLEYGFTFNDLHNYRTVWELILEMGVWPRISRYCGWPVGDYFTSSRKWYRYQHAIQAPPKWQRHPEFTASPSVSDNAIPFGSRLRASTISRGLKYLFKRCADTKIQNRNQKTALETVSGVMKRVYHEVERDLIKLILDGNRTRVYLQLWIAAPFYRDNLNKQISTSGICERFRR